MANNLYINTPVSLSLNKNKEKKLEPSKFEKNEAEEYPIEETNLTYWACKILKTADPKEKCLLTNEVAEKWKNNQITNIGELKSRIYFW